MCMCVHNILASVAARILFRHTLCCGSYTVSSLHFQWVFLFAWWFCFLLGRSLGSKLQFFSYLEVEYWRSVKKACKISFSPATILQTNKKQVERANLKLPKYDDIPLICNIFLKLCLVHLTDFDDCKMWGVCDQLCEDRVGHHQCHCVEGYFLEHHRHCRANTSG